MDGGDYLARTVYKLVDAQCGVTAQEVDGATKQTIETEGSTPGRTGLGVVVRLGVVVGLGLPPAGSGYSAGGRTVQTTPPATTPPAPPPVTDPPITTPATDPRPRRRRRRRRRTASPERETPSQ